MRCYHGLVRKKCVLLLTLIDQDPMLDNTNNISDVFNFEKDKKPCSRPLSNDHHEYHFILQFTETDLQSRSYIKDGTILIRVNRE